MLAMLVIEFDMIMYTPKLLHSLHSESTDLVGEASYLPVHVVSRQQLLNWLFGMAMPAARILPALGLLYATVSDCFCVAIRHSSGGGEGTLACACYMGSNKLSWPLSCDHLKF